MKKEFIIQRQGKDMVLYAGLLDLAHEKGLTGIKTHLIQAPTDANGGVCICHATAEFGEKFFDGIGDASAGNVGPHIRPHIIRMAETRAKARALRDATNIGMVSVEELGDDDAPEPKAARPAQQPARAPEKPATPARTPEAGNEVTVGAIKELALKLGWSSTVLNNRLSQKYEKPGTTPENLTPAQRVEVKASLDALIVAKEKKESVNA